MPIKAVQWLDVCSNIAFRTNMSMSTSLAFQPVMSKETQHE